VVEDDVYMGMVTTAAVVVGAGEKKAAVDD
jgi:hypothetical protein